MVNAAYHENKDIPESMLLGNMLFFNLTDMTVDESTLLSLLKQNNLPESFARKISKADAFRRATSSIKNENVVYTDDQNNTFDGKLNVDEVVNDSDTVKRIVGVRVLNDKQEEVYYKQIGTLTFDRNNDTCNYSMDANIKNAYNDADCAVYDALLQKTQVRYMTWATYHNHDTVKNMVNRIVNSMHPVALMPTGICKFISKNYKQTLYGLKGLLNDLSQYSDNGGENTVEIIPIIDTDEHRDLVNQCYEQEMTESLYEYSQELAEILKKKTVLSTRQANTYIERFKVLRDKATNYQALLGTYQSNIMDQLKAAVQQVQDNRET